MRRYVLEPLGQDETIGTPLYKLLDERTADIIRRQKEEESRRKWTLALTIGGLFFAAARLGIIAIPHLRRRAKL